MSSKHSLWQSRWDLDQSEGVATHESGLRVRLQQDGNGVAENAADVASALIPQHGEHNASAMIQRLIREGASLLIDPFSRGWRG